MKNVISIDKITVVLGLTISPNTFKMSDMALDNKLYKMGCKFEVFKYKHIKTDKPFTYEHHIELWDGESSKMIINLFRLGIDGHRNSDCEFTFNPNKHYSDFQKVLLALSSFGFNKIREITRVDIAADFPVSPVDVEMLCRRPITTIQFVGDHFTRYKRYSDGVVMRVYNKAVEEGSKIPKTRCELVMKNWIKNKRDNFDIINKHYADIYIKDLEYMLNLPKHIAYSLQNLPSCKIRDFIPLLNVKYREEAERYLRAKYKRFNFTIDDYYYISNLLYLYLPTLKKGDL